MDKQDFNAFIAPVTDMRTAQKLFFNGRSYEALNRSKVLERQVDAMLVKITSGQGEML